jgi:elongation factor G
MYPEYHSSIKWIGMSWPYFLSSLGVILCRPGANPWRIVQQIRSKLRMPAAALHVPIGVESEFSGVVDLVSWKAIYNEGDKGHVPLRHLFRLSRSCRHRSTVVQSDEIPASVLELAKVKRAELVEQVAEVDEELGELFLNDEVPTNEQLAAAIRRATVGLKFSPVFLGSAIKNTAVQALLDGVCAYLSNPSEVNVVAHDTNLPVGAPPVTLVPAAAAPLVGLAFKLEEGRFGQLTYMRVYQGTLKRGNTIFNARTGKKVKVPRLVRMHSDEMEVRLVFPGGCIPSGRTAIRISTLLDLVKSVPFSASNVPLVTHSRMARPTSLWYLSPAQFSLNLLMTTLQDIDVCP